MKKIFFTITTMLSFLTYAQEDITVNVIDFNTNLPVSGISLTLENSQQGVNLTEITNTLGKAFFNSVPVLNGYQVTFNGNDIYAPSVSEIIDIRSNQDIVLQILLVPASTNNQNLEEVVVTSNKTTARINRKSAEVSFMFRKLQVSFLKLQMLV